MESAFLFMQSRLTFQFILVLWLCSFFSTINVPMSFLGCSRGVIVSSSVTFTRVVGAVLCPHTRSLHFGDDGQSLYLTCAVQAGTVLAWKSPSTYKNVLPIGLCDVPSYFVPFLRPNTFFLICDGMEIAR